MQTINERIGIILKKSGMKQTAFAEALKVSQQYISKLIKEGNPSERLIDDICEKIKINDEPINKEWIYTGEGELTIKLTRNQEIAKFLNDVMKLPDEDIKKQFIDALSKLDERDWETLNKIANGLRGEK